MYRILWGVTDIQTDGLSGLDTVDKENRLICKHHWVMAGVQTDGLSGQDTVDKENRLICKHHWVMAGVQTDGLSGQDTVDKENRLICKHHWVMAGAQTDGLSGQDTVDNVNRRNCKYHKFFQLVFGAFCWNACSQPINCCRFCVMKLVSIKCHNWAPQNLHATIEHYVNLRGVTVWCWVSVLGVIRPIFFEKKSLVKECIHFLRHPKYIISTTSITPNNF